MPSAALKNEFRKYPYSNPIEHEPEVTPDKLKRRQILDAVLERIDERKKRKGKANAQEDVDQEVEESGETYDDEFAGLESDIDMGNTGVS